jgi:hypothetical protein
MTSGSQSIRSAPNSKANRCASIQSDDRRLPDMRSRSRGLRGPSCVAHVRPPTSRGRREGQVPAGTCGPPAEKKQAAVTTGSTGSTGLPCADGLRLIRDLPGDRLYCPRRPRARRFADLASAPGCQDHTISPSAPCRSSVHETYTATLRVHRIPASRAVTIAIRPSRRGGTMHRKHNF